MEEIGVDRVSSEFFEAFLELGFYTSWSDVIDASISLERISEFRDDPDIFSHAFERFPEIFFALSHSVYRSSIKGSNSESICIFEE